MYQPQLRVSIMPRDPHRAVAHEKNRVRISARNLHDDSILLPVKYHGSRHVAELALGPHLEGMLRVAELPLDVASPGPHMPVSHSHNRVLGTACQGGQTLKRAFKPD